jgi:hypothetical protein
MAHRGRINVFVEQHALDLMEAIKAYTGLSLSEQVRRGLRSWLVQNHRAVTGALRHARRPRIGRRLGGL